MDAFSDYDDAYNLARIQANQLQRTVGIEKTREYGRTVYRVHLLPKPECRFGFELRCELVEPGSPKCEKVGKS